MTSEVEIANLALIKLGGVGTIVSFTDDSEEARAVNANYAQALRAELRAHPWNCARKRDILAPDSTAPLFGFDYAFNLPSDFLRLVRHADLQSHDWQIEGRQLLTSETDTLELVYIGYITDPNQMDALLIEAFSCRLALSMVTRLTQSSTKKQEIAAEYKEAISEAKKTNAIERPAQEPEYDSWLTDMQ